MVAMAPNPIGLKVVAAFSKQGAQACLAAGPGYPGFAICNDMLCIDQGGILKQGRQAQQYGDRIATWVGHHTSVADALAMQLYQAVDCLAQYIGAGMLLFVPLLENRG